MKFGRGQQRQEFTKSAVSQQRTKRGQTERAKRPTRGASRTAPQPKGEKFDVKGFGNKLLRWLGYTSVVGLVAVIGYGTVTWASGQLDRPVNSVKINGEFTRISQKEVAEIIYDAMGSSFMKLDLEDIQERLENQAWIDRARVARRWPDQLEVTVIEHKPIARWGQADVLNHRGEVIRLSGESAAEGLLQGLPELDGLEGMEQAMMAQYQVLNKMLVEHGLEVKQLVCNASRSWTITLSDGVVIRIGRDQMMAKMRRFLLVYKAQLQAQWADLNSIDLRYYNGVAVQWRQPKSA